MASQILIMIRMVFLIKAIRPGMNRKIMMDSRIRTVLRILIMMVMES
jgi:hypothetical protein